MGKRITDLKGRDGDIVSKLKDFSVLRISASKVRVPMMMFNSDFIENIGLT